MQSAVLGIAKILCRTLKLPGLIRDTLIFGLDINLTLIQKAGSNISDNESMHSAKKEILLCVILGLLIHTTAAASSRSNVG